MINHERKETLNSDSLLSGIVFFLFYMSEEKLIEPTLQREEATHIKHR